MVMVLLAAGIRNSTEKSLLNDSEATERKANQKLRYFFRVLLMIIYKILRHSEFLELEKKRKICGSSNDVSDGFIHFSTKEQIRETLSKHFNLERRLILMAVEIDSVLQNLQWEESRAGQMFPHLYSKLDFDSAIWFAPIELYEDTHILPHGI